MTETMRVLFHCLSEKRVPDCFTTEYRQQCVLLERQEAALLALLDDRQKALWEKWADTRAEREYMYREALFRAAWQAARET